MDEEPPMPFDLGCGAVFAIALICATIIIVVWRVAV